MLLRLVKTCRWSRSGGRDRRFADRPDPAHAASSGERRRAADRLLPGRDIDGAPICRDCAGIVRDFFCDRCGFEGLPLGGRLCEHCILPDTLVRLLDDGTGRVAPAFLPLVKVLLEMDRSKSRLTWLRNPNVVRHVAATDARGSGAGLPRRSPIVSPYDNPASESVTMS
ncbi:hypothetical protein [Streptomyces sp. NPDC086989]|uniref:hypothetical protein n=1 Tax=Streptomyces sp. NPDC086989 TaxID=3365764 RepID=UPI0038111EEF